MDKLDRKYRAIFQRCRKDPEFEDKVIKYLEGLMGTKCQKCGHIIGECY